MPGVGKTRLFLELVKMTADERKRCLLDVDDNVKEKKALINDLLPIAVSFNGCTLFNSADSKITGQAECLSHIVIRILHIWLTNELNITLLSRTMAAALKSGALPQKEFTLGTVLSLVSRRAGHTEMVVFTSVKEATRSPFATISSIVIDIFKPRTFVSNGTVWPSSESKIAPYKSFVSNLQVLHAWSM